MGKVKSLIKRHLKRGRKDLLRNEAERLYILSQCGKDKNVLYADFRADEICFAYDRLKAKGLTLNILFKFQEQVPVIYPWNLEYASLRFDVNRRFNVFPLMIVMCRSKKDVIKSFAFAQKYDINISIRGGSHSFEAFSLGDGMIIDQSHRKGVCVKKNNQVVLEPGVLLGPLADQLYKRKLLVVSGTCPNNCISGYALGGGIGFLVPKYGVTSDTLLEVEMLLASGEVVKANQNNYEDLYWASRGGGGGNFGIVLSLKFQAFPIDLVYTLNISYPFEQLGAVLKTWQQQVSIYPEDLSLEFVATTRKALEEDNINVDDLENNNSTVRNKAVIVAGLYLGQSKEVLEGLLQPFLTIPNLSVTITQKTYVEATMEFSNTGRWLPFFKTKNSFITTPFGDEAIAVISNFMGQGSDQNGSDFTSFAINTMCGQNHNVDPTATAFPYRTGTLGWLLINSQWDNQTEGFPSFKWITKFYDALQPFLPPEVYVNAPDLQLKDYLNKYYGVNLQRLVEVKQKYDPTNVFNYPQSIPTSL